MNELIEKERYSNQTFEDIKHIDESENEFWYARELMRVLEYKQWRRFENVIEKAKESCKNSNLKVIDCFANVGKPIISGKGFSSRNLRTMRKFYLMYPIWKTLSSKLSWSHYLELIKIEEESKRNFYLNECINSRWSVRELQRQKNSLLYERLVLTTDKDRVLELSQKGQIFKESKDLVKDPFVLEFLDIKENTEYLETDLEKNIIEHLKEFLLELGEGFMFVGNQVRITLGD